MESPKHVMTKDKLDKHLSGQSLTPYMALKMKPSEKCKPIKSDEYNLLDKQNNRLADVMYKMDTIPLSRQNQQNRPYKPNLHMGTGRDDRN